VRRHPKHASPRTTRSVKITDLRVGPPADPPLRAVAPRPSGRCGGWGALRRSRAATKLDPPVGWVADIRLRSSPSARNTGVVTVEDLFRRDFRLWLLGEIDRTGQVGEAARFVLSSRCCTGADVAELLRHTEVEHDRPSTLRLLAAIGTWRQLGRDGSDFDPEIEIT
jgi:hypothetical protein